LNNGLREVNGGQEHEKRERERKIEKEGNYYSPRVSVFLIVIPCS